MRKSSLTYVIGVAVLAALGLLVDAAMLRAALTGAIMATVERGARVAFWATAYLALRAIELAWNIFGGVAVFSDNRASACDRDQPPAYTLLRAMIIIAYIVAGVRLVGLFLAFDVLGANWQQEQQLKRWRRWVKRVCCYAPFCVLRNKLPDELWMDMGDLFNRVFGGADLVASDLEAGLVLLRARQQAMEREQSTKWLLATPFEGEADQKLMQELKYYMNYALGAYGWALLMFQRPARCVCLTCANCRPACQAWSRVRSDAPCLLNTSSLLAQARLPASALLHASFHDEPSEPPFFVAFDAANNTLVVVVRGTLSIKDCVTDALVSFEDIVLPSGETARVHAGFFRSAQYIARELESRGLLARARGGSGGEGSGSAACGLVVTGHSLGAGVATVLAMRLRPAFPQLRCFAFSPPGATVCETGARYTEGFVVSLVVGYDMVARLSTRALLKAKKDMLQALHSCPQNKCAVTGICCSCFGGKLEPWWKSPVDVSAEWKKVCEATGHTSMDLAVFPPGRIVHLVHTGVPRKAGFQRRRRDYLPVWRSRYYFDHLIMNLRAPLDHFPDYVTAQLQQLSDGDVAAAGARLRDLAGANRDDDAILIYGDYTFSTV